MPKVNTKKKSLKKKKTTRAEVKPSTSTAVPTNVVVVKQKEKIKKSSKRVSDTPQHRMLCAITDPFCHHARGGKVPDDSTVPTFPWQLKTLFPITTGVSGQANGMILANNYLGYMSPNVSPATTGAITAASFNPWSGIATAAANFQAARIVSMGAIFHPTLDFSTSRGYVITGEVPRAVTGASYTDGSTDFVNSKIHELVPGRPLSWISRPQGPQSRIFHFFDAASMDDEGFSSLHWEIIGGPGSATVGLMEVVINLEVIPKNNNAVLSKLATPAAPHTPKVLDAQNKVMDKISSFIEGGAEAVGLKIAQYAGEALTFAVGALL